MSPVLRKNSLVTCTSRQVIIHKNIYCNRTGLIIIASTFTLVTNMSLVCLLYALVALQGFIVILHFAGKGYIISLIFELTFLSFRVLISFSQSAFRWVLPPRKSLHGELALVTGAASGIGRLISLRLAEKGWLFFF